MLMERCVQTDVLDIVTGSEKGSRDLLILPCAKEQTLPNVLGGGVIETCSYCTIAEVYVLPKHKLN